MEDRPVKDRLLLLLQLSTFCCLAGWAWVHLYWEGPLGKWFWQDATFQWLQSLGYTWDDLVGTGASDGLIQRVQRYIGYCLLFCSAAVLVQIVLGNSKSAKVICIAALCLGFVILSLVFYAKFDASERQPPMLIEHGGQALMPIILISALLIGARHRCTIAIATVAMILTFAGHGCYALGLWPTPGTFYAMTTVILDLSYEKTQSILRVAGALDFLVCLGVLIPWVRRSSAAYGVLWGFLTAAARPVAGMSTELNYWGADQFLHEAVLRAPHFMIPLYLFLVWRSPNPDSTPHAQISDS